MLVGGKRAKAHNAAKSCFESLRDGRSDGLGGTPGADVVLRDPAAPLARKRTAMELYRDDCIAQKAFGRGRTAAVICHVSVQLVLCLAIAALALRRSEGRCSPFGLHMCLLSLTKSHGFVCETCKRFSPVAETMHGTIARNPVSPGYWRGVKRGFEGLGSEDAAYYQEQAKLTAKVARNNRQEQKDRRANVRGAAQLPRPSPTAAAADILACSPAAVVPAEPEAVSEASLVADCNDCNAAWMLSSAQTIPPLFAGEAPCDDPWGLCVETGEKSSSPLHLHKFKSLLQNSSGAFRKEARKEAGLTLTELYGKMDDTHREPASADPDFPEAVDYRDRLHCGALCKNAHDVDLLRMQAHLTQALVDVAGGMVGANNTFYFWRPCGE